MNDLDLIWNRAAMDNGGLTPGPGDFALSALLYAHGLAMNGGVLHAVELLSPTELAKAQSGYRFFGLVAISDLLRDAWLLVRDGADLGSHEQRLDAEYMMHANDSALTVRFEQYYLLHPSDFAPTV